MKISLVKDTINQDDINSLIDWLKTNPRLTKGPLTTQFEMEWSKFLGVEYSTYVNSGSSALLLALTALKISGRPGTNIIVPSLSWATDVSSIVYSGYNPIFCDSSSKDLNIDPSKLETLFIEYKPAALLLVHVLGFVNDMETILDLCNKYNVTLIEDCCETMGSTYKGKFAGTFGLISCFSMYYGHTISSIEGGIVSTSDKEINNILKMVRNHGWDRDLDLETQQKLRTEHNINEFKSFYTFYQLGYNLRSTDLQAHIALDQIKKLPDFIKKRHDNFYKIQNSLDGLPWRVEPTLGCSTDIISNFAYPIIHPKHEAIVKALIDGGVETRPLIAGALSTQPFLKNREVISNATWVETIADKQGFYIPNNPDLSDEEIQYMTGIIRRFI